MPLMSLEGCLDAWDKVIHLAEGGQSEWWYGLVGANDDPVHKELQEIFRGVFSCAKLACAFSKDASKKELLSWRAKPKLSLLCLKTKTY